jgi:hypothetical protein
LFDLALFAALRRASSSSLSRSLRSSSSSQSTFDREEIVDIDGDVAR